MFVDHWQLSRRLVLHVFHNVSSLSVVVCSHGHPNRSAAAHYPPPHSAARLCMSDSSSLLSLACSWWSAFTGRSFPHSSPLSGPPSLPPFAAIVLPSKHNQRCLERTEGRERRENGMRSEANWLRMTGQRAGRMELERLGGWQVGEGQIKGRGEGQRGEVAEPKLATLPQMPKSYFVTGKSVTDRGSRWRETAVEERGEGPGSDASDWKTEAACEFSKLPWALGGWSTGSAESQRGKKKGREDSRRNKEDKWQEVTQRIQAFISEWKRVRGALGERRQRRRVSERKRESASGNILQIPSVHQLSIHSGDMKRPHDYSSPDSDTDEFIDVGQEDGFWWASWGRHVKNDLKGI